MLFIADKLKQKNDFRNLQQVTKKYYTFPTEKNYSFPEIKITTVDYTKPSSNILISNTKNNDFTLKNKVQVKADLIRKPVKGGKVRHRKFGIGIIEEIDEQKDRIIILFGSQQRVFILSSAIGTYLELLD